MYILSESDLARFWEKVDRRGDDECWPWLAGKLHHGHGAFRLGHLQTHAHRISYVIHFGAIPSGKQVNHRCGNPPCVNPRHLYAGTQLENMRDRDLHGRTVNVLVTRQRAKTHCPKGHEYTPENTRYAKNSGGKPKRQCRICYRAYQRDYWTTERGRAKSAAKARRRREKRRATAHPTPGEGDLPFLPSRTDRRRSCTPRSA